MKIAPVMLPWVQAALLFVGLAPDVTVASDLSIELEQSRARIQRLEDDWRSAPAYLALSERLQLCHEELGPRHRETIETLFRLGRLSEIADLTAEGNELLKIAEALARESLGADDPMVAEILIRLARLWRGFRPHLIEETADYFSQADEIIRRCGDPPNLRGEYLYARGGQERLEGRLDEAVSLYREALTLREQAFGEDDLRTINNLVWLGWLERRMGLLESAEQRLRRAVTLLEERDSEGHALRASALDFLSQIARGRGEYKRAEEYARSAVDAVERSRPYQLPTQRHLGAHARISLATLLLRHGNEEEAWRTTLPALGPRTRDAVDAAPARDRSLGQQASLAEERLQLLFSKWQADGDVTLDELTSALVRAVSYRARQIERALNRQLDGSGAVRHDSLPHLPHRTAMVGWIALGWDALDGEHEHVAWAWVLRTRDGRPQWKWLKIGDWKRSEDYQAWFRPYRERRIRMGVASKWATKLEVDPTLEAEARLLAERLFAPLQPLLEDVDHLIVLPSYGFRELEVESFVDGEGVPLSERYAISYLSSPDVYETLTRPDLAKDPSSMRALVVGDPAYDGEDFSSAPLDPSLPLDTTIGASLLRSVLAGKPGSFEKLPRLIYSRLESENVAALFSATTQTWVGKLASETRLRSLSSEDGLARFGVVHFATHALYDPKFGNRSALALSLSEEDETDGLVTLGEIESSWRLNADLVTLSGCQTGPARFYLESGGSFLMPLLASGARSVLATRWKVDDRATSMLMHRFYESVTGSFSEARMTPGGSVLPGTPIPKAQALSEATTWLREYETSESTRPFAHPFYWAGFFLFGDPR